MQPVLVVKDERYAQHLDGVFHLENPKRIEAIHTMLQDPSLAGRWSEVIPRLASPEELAWVHTPDYIEQVAKTAGKPLFAFDVDTQTAFYDSSDVLYFSLHQFPCYPGTGNLGEVGRGKGEGYTVNVPLAKGHGDRDFTQVIYFLLNPIAREYQPDMILVTCGFDLYQHDRLAEMQGTPAGYALITHLLLDIAEAVCGGHIVFIMEGGYSIKGIQACGLRVMQELCDIPSLNGKQLTKIKGSNPSRFSVIKKVMEVQRKYWKALQ